MTGWKFLYDSNGLMIEDSRDLYLLKTDSNGVQQWTKTYGGSDQDAGHSIRNTPDGGYGVAGFTKKGIADYDVYALKVDSNGNL